MTAIEVIAQVIRKEFYDDEHFHEMEIRIITESHAKDIIKALEDHGYKL